MRVGVVGAGIMGLCTARELARRGSEVTLYEQHRPGNPFGSSFGRSRIVRQAYPDQFYTEILLEGHDMWHALEAETGRKIVHEVGLLFVAPKDAPEMWHELEALENLRVPHRVLTPADIRSVHSHMVLQPDEVAVMTLSAGWADVPAVLGALMDDLSSRGVVYVQDRVIGLGPGAKVVSVKGGAAQFDRVVVTAGSWVTKFIDLPVRTTLQTFAYLDVAMTGPVWIEGFGDHLYGFPTEPGTSASKIGYHTAGPETDPDSPEREPQAQALDVISAGAVRRFGRKANVVETGACLYTTAANDDFRILWADDRVLVASPCSGHGFKFGPWMGRFLADLVEGRQDLADWPRFSL